MSKTVLPVTYPGGSYDVLIGQDLLPRIRQISPVDGPIAVITDSNVGPLHAGKIDSDYSVIDFPAGEKNKTLATVQKLYNDLLAQGFDRQGIIVALGGGVVGDVAGFVAATYMRGVDVIQCPTSLLAMVDASVGGKTGVDLPQGKNLIGAFKQPAAVLVDLDTLSTLSPEEFTSGMAEVIKAGLIGDGALFENLAANPLRAPVSEQNCEYVEAAVVDAIRLKRDVIEEDPFEKGRRAVLNLGHTFGHAVEQLSGYAIRHGEAVAIGMMVAANLSVDLGFCSPSLPERIGEVLLATGLPVRIPESQKATDIYQMMGSDKKKAGKQIRFVLLRDVADVFVTGDVPEKMVLNTLKQCGAR